MLNKIDEFKIKMYLKKEKLEYFKSIETFDNTHLRGKEEVIKKAIATLITIQAACDFDKGNNAFEESKAFMLTLLDKYDAKKYLSKREEAIFYNKIESIEAKLMIQSYEAVNVLFWYLDIVKKLESPSEECDFNYLITALASCEDYSMFDRHTISRPLKMVYFNFELTNRFKLALKNDATTKTQKMIVRERLKAFRWLLNIDKNWT